MKISFDSVQAGVRRSDCIDSLSGCELTADKCRDEEGVTSSHGATNSGLLQGFCRLGNNGAEYALGVASACIAPIPVILSYEAIARYYFNAPTVWAWDLALQLGGGAMMLGAPYALRTGMHVRLDLFTQRRSDVVRACLDLLGAIAVLFCAALLVWFGIGEAWHSTIQYERMSTIWAPPIFVLRWTIPISGVLLFMVGVDLCRKAARSNVHGKCGGAGNE